MKWIGLILLGIFLIIILIICIRFKAELKITRDEQWVEVRYFLFKYRIDLKNFIDEKLKLNFFQKEMTRSGENPSQMSEDYESDEIENQKASTVKSTDNQIRKMMNETDSKESDQVLRNVVKPQKNSIQKNQVKKIIQKQEQIKSSFQEEQSIIELDNEVKKIIEQASDIKTFPNVKSEEPQATPSSFEKIERPALNQKDKVKNQETITTEAVEKIKRRFRIKPLMAPKLIKRLKAIKVFNINALRKLDINKIRYHYYRFKTIFKRGKYILYRFLSRIRIHKLESILYFSVDEPALNAQLMATIWATEANFYHFIQKHFKKVDSHKFDLKSQFSGNEIFLETSCIISLRIVDIIIVVLWSLKDILKIKRMITLEKEV